MVTLLLTQAACTVIRVGSFQNMASFSSEYGVGIQYFICTVVQIEIYIVQVVHAFCLLKRDLMR